MHGLSNYSEPMRYQAGYGEHNEALHITFEKPVKMVLFTSLTEDNQHITFEELLNRHAEETDQQDICMPLLIFLVYADDSVERRVIP